MKAPQQTTKKSSRVGFWVVVLLIACLGLMTYFLTLVRVSGHSMNPSLHDGQILFLQRYPLLLGHSYQQGDIIVLSPPRELHLRAVQYIKRIIALPDDSVSVVSDIVYLNGQHLSESYITQSSSRTESFPEVIISKGEVVAFEGYALAELPEYLKDTLTMLEPPPQDSLEQSYTETVSYVGTIKLKKAYYFVLGDNRDFSASEDSRLFGAIRAASIQGIARPF
jgi:signal peptidase I